MALYTREFLEKVAKAHRQFGISFRFQTRKGKQYVSMNNRDVNYLIVTYWKSHEAVNDPVQSLFPNAYVTSGMWGGGTFDVTYRVNP